MRFGPALLLIAGMAATALLALAVAQATGRGFAQELDNRAQIALSRSGGRAITASFTTARGWATRHAVLSSDHPVDTAVRAQAARTVAAIPGVGGVRWADGSTLAYAREEPPHPLHCQKDVEALLRTRTIRFEESSVTIDPASRELVNEVAKALRPCLGSIIAITGHTDSSGPEPGNIALSRDRADAVRRALVRRGIPADGIRTMGVGSAQPVEGLDSADPANRRIEFSVIATVPLRPTPVDRPGPR